MSVDLDQVTANIVKGIDNLTALRKQRGDVEVGRMMEAVKQKQELAMKQQEKQIMTPFEMIMARQYADQHPEMDFSGVPGFPARQTTQGQPAAQTPAPVMSLVGGGGGDAAGNLMPPQPMQPPQQVQPQVQPQQKQMRYRVNASGHIEEIPLKEKSIRAMLGKELLAKVENGDPLSEQDTRLLAKVNNIDLDKGELDDTDLLKIRTLATDMVKREGIDESMITEEQIQAKIPEAKDYLYPNANTDGFGFYEGQVKKFKNGKKGKYIGNNRWENME